MIKFSGGRIVSYLVHFEKSIFYEEKDELTIQGRKMQDQDGGTMNRN